MKHSDSAGDRPPQVAQLNEDQQARADEFDMISKEDRRLVELDSRR